MKLTVIIVNYNVKFFLHQCLCSVERALVGIDGEIVVVDNHSTDGSVPFLRTRHPKVRFIENDKNLGFATANNLVLRQCRSDYALLLNPDTVIGEDTLRTCVDWMDRHQQTAGAIGVSMCNANGTFAKESRRGVPTPWVAFCKLSGLCALFPHSPLFGRYYMDYRSRETATEIEIVSGACMMLNRRAMDKAGLLDEDFFMYGEDIDLSYRLLKAGYQNFYVPAHILHYKGESTQKASVGYVNVFHQAMLIFFRKHFSTYSRWASLPIQLCIWLKAAAAHAKAWMRRKCDAKRSSLFYMSGMTYRLHDERDREEAEKVLRTYDIAIAEPTAKADYLIFNAERTPFADIVNLLERQDDSNRCRVATLFPSLHVLITSSYVFQAKNS